MNPQSLFVVLARLIALWYGVATLIEGPIALSMVADAIARETILAGSRASSVWPALLIWVQMIAALALWIFAPLLARLATRGVKSDLQTPQFTVADCYSVGFVLVGTWFVTKYLASGLTWAHYLFLKAVSTSGTSWRQGIDWYGVVQVFLTLVFGVVLIVFGRKWAVLLAQKQQAAELTNQTHAQLGATPASSEPR